MENLKYKPLSQFADLLNGYAFKSKNYVDSGIRVIRIANVQDGYISDEKPCFYPLDTVEDISKYILRENDFLVSLTGNVGRVALLTEDFLPAALNQRVSCIRIKDENLLPNFLFYYFLRKQFQKDCINASQGVAQLNLSTKWLEQYPIPVLSLNEQKRIVARIEELFSELDNGVETLKKTKQQLAVYRQSVLKEAFSSSTASYRRLEDLCFFITKGTTPSKAAMTAGNGEIPFIKVYNLTFDNTLDFSIDPTFVDKDTHVGFLGRSIVYPGDVLMNIVGPPMGKVSIVPDLYSEWNINQAIARFRCMEGLYNKYLAYFLGYSDTVEKMKSKAKATAGQFNLTLEICRDIQIPIPSIEEQKKIVFDIETKLSQQQKIADTIELALQQAEAMRQSILKKAFEGEL